MVAPAGSKFAIFTRNETTLVRTQQTCAFNTYAIAKAGASLLFDILNIEEDGEEWAVFYGHRHLAPASTADVYTIELV